jgi:RNA polymerase sigma factor (sigma-70 family)
MERKYSNRDDELNLLSAFVQGDPEAAKIFFKKYGGIIKHAVGKADIKGNVIDREDLFQDLITYILNDDMKIVRDFRGKCKFSTYLYTICRRYAIKKVSRESKIHSGDEALPSQSELPITLIEQTEIWDEDQKKALHKAIEKLDEDSQIFIRMMFYDIRSTSEIMIFFGWNSPNTVYSKKNKIIAKLRKMTRKILEK